MSLRLKFLKLKKMMSRIIRGNKFDKVMEKLSLEQLFSLRKSLSESLTEKGMNPDKHLEYLDDDIANKIIEEEKDKFLRNTFTVCKYKNKKGEECGELDCSKHILNKNNVLVCKKSMKTPKIIEIEEEDDSE